ncbi:gene transfer agent family protein [Rhodobaculum claviforme]|uniref:Gene transfer agent family protein n=1 Tax=Rhodobaculum claviforme TaxID=1549854 RepID=A0A934TLV7_9RHOB|nr:gene transfer agent family protein [Rhodobaculum claviforme]MBK5928520.1 hypothetical protein [Rhodobaculum claviforme]
MANPHAGEVALWVNGRREVLKLTLGALAELEAGMRTDSLVALVERFESGRFTTRDVLCVLVAGLRGGGWPGDADDIAQADIRGGPVEAARVAAQLLARAFAGHGLA